MKIQCLYLFALLWVLADGALFSWLFKSNKDSKTAGSKTGGDGGDSRTAGDPKQASHRKDVNTDVVIGVNIPFEIRSADEKFLVEAAQYTSLQLSELDKCHHKVVLGLHTSCSDLTEEELSKVAVNLLNCQSLAEGRQIYPCTTPMTLAECTKNMDPNTWNAYHIVSNRARAVCYSSRQDQFRAKTEMAVNKLMHSAEEQIRSMEDLQESQEALGKATSDTFDSLSDGHEVLQKKQNQLSVAQHTIQNYITSNLRELYKEKRIIAAGQRELAYITESIKRKLDEAQKQLTVQEKSQKGVHNQILLDLSDIQEDARKVWEKLDVSTGNILLKHEETIQQFSRLTRDIRDMNDTVHHLMDLVKDKLTWITALIGSTDNTVQKVYCCTLHAGYFLIAMLAASFLQVPYLTRVVLVVLVPLNALSEVKNDNSLQFTTLTTLLAICVLVNLVFSLIVGLWHRHKGQSYIRDEVRQYLKCEMKETYINAVDDINGSRFKSDLSLLNKTSSSTASTPQSKRKHIPSVRNSGDYSSDEEVILTPIPKERDNFLRRRVLENSVCLSQKNNPPESQEVSCLDNSTSFVDNKGSATKRPLDVSDTEKTISSVRRHLMEQLDNSRVSMHSGGFSLGNRSRSNTPLRGTPSSSRSGTPMRGSSFTKNLCAATCKNGQLCRKYSGSDSLYCNKHAMNASNF